MRIGVTAIDRATTTVSSSTSGPDRLPAVRANCSTTKANSPAWLSSTASSSRSATCILKKVARTNSTSILRQMSATTSARTSSGFSITTRKAIDMPTVMKNRPSSSPLNGCRLLSSSCRYSLSASSTPPKKAPSAGDRPRLSVSRAAPITSASAKAVKASGTRVRASQLISGRMTKREPNRAAMKAPTTTRASHQSIGLSTTSSTSSPIASIGPPPMAVSSGMRASTGITATSCTRRMASEARPVSVLVILRWSTDCMAMAVELIASARPTTTASAQPKPITRASSATTTLVAAIWVSPRPSTLLRMRQSSVPSTSRPIRNSIMTMPNSAIW